MSRYQQDLERGFRMTQAFDHAWERKPFAMAAARDAWLARVETEANAGIEAFDRAAAQHRHPAGQLRDCTPPRFGPPPAWTPTPKPTPVAPPKRSILRDLATCLRALINPNHHTAQEN